MPHKKQETYTNTPSHRDGDKQVDGRPNKRKPKKVSEAYLERAALHYLGRFNSSESNLIQVLERKVRRRNDENAIATGEQKQWIHNVVSKCVRLGYVNDVLYAKQRAEALLRKGKPTRVIQQDLKFKGIAEELAILTVRELSEDDDVDPDAQAAAAYVRRRRFGAYRRETADIEQKREKEIAAMMRAGFRYEMINKTLDMSDDEIIDLLR